MPPKSVPVQTGLEMHDDSELPIEEIAAEVLTPKQEEYEKELANDTPLDSDEESEDSIPREKWQGGYLTVFSEKTEAENNPPLREDSSPALSEDGKPIFKIFVVKYRAFESASDSDPDNLHIVYVWARNTQESIVVVAKATFEFSSQQFGAKRGRRKLFKPDENMVKMLTLFIATKNQSAIEGILSSYPDYQYVLDKTTPPEFATVKPIAVVKK